MRSFSLQTNRALLAHVPVVAAILFLAAIPVLATVEKDFFQNADLSNAANYSPSGVPGSASDVLLTTSSTALTLNGASLSMSSLNQLNNVPYNISSGSIFLGPLSGNVVSPGANDAIYLGGSNSSLAIQGSVSLQVRGDIDVTQSGA